MDHQAAYSSAARDGHAQATYALVRLVRGVLSLSPGRKRSDPSDDYHLSMVFRRFPGVCHEARGKDGAAHAFYRGDVSELSVRAGESRAQDRHDSVARGDAGQFREVDGPP